MAKKLPTLRKDKWIWEYSIVYESGNKRDESLTSTINDVGKLINQRICLGSDVMQSPLVEFTIKRIQKTK